MQFSIKQMLQKMAKYLIFYGVPFLVAQWLQANPAIASLTVGTIMTGIMNWLKVQYSVNLPLVD